ncbi:uncharacterized protein STEHIDRAFT_126442 [Stereum hirsutum FP-91666 SS1]|uniref:Uncharacterized protein n=1 Tax=Stereum hirsutum (strain FP-91666) TaxID=721885 RepID=R7RZ27_STEHR|nr:uncharacterized protein STEHIDRAFT_126442 [Stereum hirsutum FP-91666 SS1]EIM79567.1 hypothetical protein STEHIDRAFT_126442 [Stereum hirsutum FP-91666 SS1]
MPSTNSMPRTPRRVILHIRSQLRTHSPARDPSHPPISRLPHPHIQPHSNCRNRTAHCGSPSTATLRDLLAEYVIG